jgi:hypothetical protein
MEAKLVDKKALSTHDDWSFSATMSSNITRKRVNRRHKDKKHLKKETEKGRAGYRHDHEHGTISNGEFYSDRRAPLLLGCDDNQSARGNVTA